MFFNGAIQSPSKKTHMNRAIQPKIVQEQGYPAQHCTWTGLSSPKPWIDRAILPPLPRECHTSCSGAPSWRDPPLGPSHGSPCTQVLSFSCSIIAIITWSRMGLSSPENDKWIFSGAVQPRTLNDLGLSSPNILALTYCWGYPAQNCEWLCSPRTHAAPAPHISQDTGAMHIAPVLALSTWR